MMMGRMDIKRECACDVCKRSGRLQMLPRPRSVLDDPALFGEQQRQRSVAPTGMMPVFSRAEEEDPLIKYGWQFTDEDEKKVQRDMDAGNPWTGPDGKPRPLMKNEDKYEWRNNAHFVRYRFEAQMKDLVAEERFLKMTLERLEREPEAVDLLFKQRDFLRMRLMMRLEQITNAKEAMLRQAAFNRDYFLDIIAIRHLLDRDIQADSDIAHEEMMAEARARGVDAGFRSLDDDNEGGRGGMFSSLG
jgi:hypothetical protein